ncbi:MAG: hypothetical protein CL917_16530 [Deltaproteobacteria bacterium]|nr:hypothetical protein [Deltaproteobacteria bacterium]
MSSDDITAERALSKGLPQPLTGLCLAFVGLGILGFVAGLMRDPQSTWLAFHSNFIFTTMLSCAGLVLAAIYTIVGAKWCGPYRRFAEGLAAWLPFAFIMGVIGVFGGHYLFEWYEHPMHGKENWLNPVRVYTTDLSLMFGMVLLAFFFLRASSRPTLYNLAQGEDGGQGFAQRMAQRWTANWQGQEEENALAKKKTMRLAPAICIWFGIGFSLFNFDQVMSMEQAWFSNLFGAYVCWGGILCAVAASALLGVLNHEKPGFEGEITESRMHDIGKLLFGFSIFWMYLFWSQYLVIYYGNLPEETFYLRDRLGPQFMIDKAYTEVAFARSWGSWDFDWARLSGGYGWASMVTWACCWLIPFWVLMGQKPKQTKWIVGPVAAIVLFGFWIERNLLVWPSVVKNDMSAFIGLIPICIALGFVGGFILVFLFYSRVFPSLPTVRRS